MHPRKCQRRHRRPRKASTRMMAAFALQRSRAGGAFVTAVVIVFVVVVVVLPVVIGEVRVAQEDRYAVDGRAIRSGWGEDSRASRRRRAWGRRLQGFAGSALSAAASSAGASLNMGGGRGVGVGRYRRRRADKDGFMPPVGPGGEAPHWRSQRSDMILTTTQQGCNINVISLKPQNAFKEDGLSPSKALYHLGWYTGLEMVQWCHVENALGPADEGRLPPATDPNCRENEALQGRLTLPSNLPLKNVDAHFLTCMDSRVGWAGISAPGGDMGQFILGLGAAEYIIGYPFSPDDVLHFFLQYVSQMGGPAPDWRHNAGHDNNPTGKGYFAMCTDEAAHEAWFKAAKVDGPSILTQRWNPLDTVGRRNLLKKAALPEHIGDVFLRSLVEAESEKEYGVRKEIAAAAIRAYYAVWFDPFNSLRSHLLYPILGGEQKPSAVINIESPESCHPLSPLVVQKIHSSTPTAGSELLKIGGEKDGSEAGSAFLELQSQSKAAARATSLRANVRAAATGDGDTGGEAGDKAGDGSQVLVHHYLAAANYRATLADFFSDIFGLDRDRLLAKMNRLGNDAAAKLVAKVASGKPQYAAAFLK